MQWLTESVLLRLHRHPNLAVPLILTIFTPGTRLIGQPQSWTELGSWQRQRKDGVCELPLTASLPQVSAITTTHEFSRARRDMVGHVAT